MHLLNYKPLNLIILTNNINKTEKFAISREIPGPGVEKDGKSQFSGITFGWEIENPRLVHCPILIGKSFVVKGIFPF